MDGFAAQQPDEGYSEDPLIPSTTKSASYVPKPRNDAVSALAARRSGAEFPEWLTRHIASLSVHDKTRECLPLIARSLAEDISFHGFCHASAILQEAWQQLSVDRWSSIV